MDRKTEVYEMATILDNKHIDAIMASLMDGIITFDRNGVIIMANKAAENLFLVNKDALQGCTMEEIGGEINSMIGEVLLRGNEVFAEMLIQPRTQIYRVHVMPIKSDRDIEGAVAVFRDVTDARNFDQMRSEFVGNVSHELRTPLTSIKGFVETLLDGAMENSAICRRFLSIIDTETERLSRLIEDLLTLSSIESKERVINPKPVCLIHCIRSVMNIMGPQISEKSLHVEFICEPDLALIYADEDLLNQVLINLLDNAIKYTPRQGKVIIRAYRSDSRVITTITDTGMGIPRDSLFRVFERFYRVDKARSRHQGGTGLGLAIVKHIVESHGGEVFVESEPGKGSTFGVSFLVV
jgi:two-component system phosphate regulon sensor histidine kinase PhoR